MKTQLLFTALVTTLLVPAAAFAADTGGYVGASIGGTKAKDAPSSSKFDAYLLANGITATSSVDDTDTGWKLFGGYKFNRYFAVEGSYADLGEFTIKSNVTDPTTRTHTTTVDVQAVTAAAVGILPLAYSFELFGKAGIHYWDTDRNATPLAQGSKSDNSTDLMYGIGAGYNLTKNFKLRAEWEMYTNIGDDISLDQSDVEMWSGGLQYNF